MRDFRVAWRVMAIAMASLSVNLFLQVIKKNVIFYF